MTANTYGRQVVIPLTNKSGGSVAAGDVVIYDSTTNDSFTTTTSASSTLAVGVAQETIANNAVGRVLIYGYAAIVNVNASVTRLNFGATHTVAKQATDIGSSRVAGTFLRFLSSGATPDAIVYPVDLAGAALTNPMTTAGDTIYGGASGAPTRLAGDTSGKVLTSNGATSAPSWQTPSSGGFASGYASVATDETTTSASFTDLATSGPAVTITVNTKVKVTIAADTYLSSSGGLAHMGVALSGANTAAADEAKKMMMYTDTAGQQVSRTIYYSGLTPGSTVFTAKYYRAGATMHFRYRTMLVECMD